MRRGLLEARRKLVTTAEREGRPPSRDEPDDGDTVIGRRTRNCFVSRAAASCKYMDLRLEHPKLFRVQGGLMSRGCAPPTPPDMRVRTRRFGRLRSAFKLVPPPDRAARQSILELVLAGRPVRA